MQNPRMPTGHQPWVTHKEHLIEPQRWGPMPCEVTVSVSILMAFEGASGTVSLCVTTVFLQSSSQASDLCFHTSDYMKNTLRPSVFFELSSSTGTVIPKVKCLEISYALDPGPTHSNSLY